MRVILQRSRRAAVSIGGETVGEIGQGLMVLLGICEADSQAECDYLADKLIHLRIFSDAEDKMNLSLADIGGEVLVVSQFTLYGDCKKGRRPSFVAAARPEHAIPLYVYFIEALRQRGVRRVETGQFGADMLVSIENDGPVTLMLDTDELMHKETK